MGWRDEESLTPRFPVKTSVYINYAIQYQYANSYAYKLSKNHLLGEVKEKLNEQCDKLGDLQINRNQSLKCKLQWLKPVLVFW